MSRPPRFESKSELADGSDLSAGLGQLDLATLPWSNTTVEESLELELKRNADAPSIARAAASAHCEGMDLSPSFRQTMALLVSEVVSNAVLHSSAPKGLPILFAASITEDVLCVTVTDLGDGFIPRARDPQARQGGYGLYILDKAAHRWGVDRIGGTRVWFELSMRA